MWFYITVIILAIVFPGRKCNLKVNINCDDISLPETKNTWRIDIDEKNYKQFIKLYDVDLFCVNNSADPISNFFF